LARAGRLTATAPDPNTYSRKVLVPPHPPPKIPRPFFYLMIFRTKVGGTRSERSFPVAAPRELDLFYLSPSSVFGSPLSPPKPASCVFSPVLFRPPPSVLTHRSSPIQSVTSIIAGFYFLSQKNPILSRSMFWPNPLSFFFNCFLSNLCGASPSRSSFVLVAVFFRSQPAGSLRMFSFFFLRLLHELTALSACSSHRYSDTFTLGIALFPLF